LNFVKFLEVKFAGVQILTSKGQGYIEAKPTFPANAYQLVVYSRRPSSLIYKGRQFDVDQNDLSIKLHSLKDFGS